MTDDYDRDSYPDPECENPNCKNWGPPRYCESCYAARIPLKEQLREASAIARIAKVLRVKLDWDATDASIFERLADGAEALLADAIIRDRL